jgi:uncharacterized protein (TIGR03067 family)
MKTARWTLVALGIVMALAVSRAGETPRDALQGVWIADYVEKNEISIPPILASLRFTFKGDKLFVSQQGGAEKEHAYAIDPTKSPRHFDIVPPGEKAVKGIYEVKGDQLTLCVQYGGGERPTEFASQASDFGLVLLMFKKKK